LITWLFEAYRDRRTYKVAAYLLLGLPFGILDFLLVVTGFSLGFGLFVTLLGIPVLVATLLLARALASFERRLAWSLLEAPMPREDTFRDRQEGVFWQRLRTLVAGGHTWREVAFLLLRLPLGVLDFSVLVAIVALALAGFAEPVVVAAGANSQLGSWTIDTFVESLVFLPVSLVFLVVGPRLVLGWGTVPAAIATSMLGHLGQDDLKRAVVQTLARTGEADGFHLLDELELQLGRGPFLTATRVEAALLALESTGYVSARRNGSRISYARTRPSGQ
jgi:hypothetical protein